VNPETWIQVYDPLNCAWLSTLMAATPLVVLLGLLVLGVSAHWSALAGLSAALAVAMFGFGMPVPMALAAAARGACYGLVPIGWIVVAALFLFSLTVRSGQFEIVKRSVANVSPDRRMQALLIAFSFSAFLEGAAGFGTPVAISAAVLIGIGFSPLYAAGLALLANTTPVAFGGLGTPLIVLGEQSGIDTMLLSQAAGRQLALFSLLVPFWMMFLMSGWRGIRGCWPAILVSGGTFGLLQFLLANYHGPALVNAVGGLGSMAALAVFLRFWQPREVWRFPGEAEQPKPGGSHEQESRLTVRQVAYAWMPWIMLSLIATVWGLPPVKKAIDGAWEGANPLVARITAPRWDVSSLRVSRAPPVVRETKLEDATYRFVWLSTTGTSVLAAAIFSAFWLRMRPRVVLQQFSDTLWRTRWALFTVACMLALASTTKYSGCDATLGLAFTKSGVLYPFFASMLGWLGVALTGSNTSSNALFGSLQRITAEQLNMNPVLIVAANSTGGVMGKMINAQSIVVAAVATGQGGHESRILRFVLLHSVLLAVLMSLLTLIQAYWLPGTIPG
jgi:lactate permease